MKPSGRTRRPSNQVVDIARDIRTLQGRICALWRNISWRSVNISQIDSMVQEVQLSRRVLITLVAQRWKFSIG